MKFVLDLRIDNQSSIFFGQLDSSCGGYLRSFSKRAPYFVYPISLLAFSIHASFRVVEAVVQIAEIILKGLIHVLGAPLFPKHCCFDAGVFYLKYGLPLYSLSLICVPLELFLKLLKIIILPRNY